MSKNAVVTGANRGIGRAIVEAFAQKGFNVWACARTKNTDFEQEMKELAEQYHVWIDVRYFDLINEEEIKKEIKSIVLQKEPIDILINNAGCTKDSLLGMTNMKDMKQVFEVNFFAPMLLMQLVSRIMIKQKSGIIINVASVSGMQNEIGRISYGSSKAALIFATRTVAMELGQYGIRVNAVAPGFINTDMWKNRKEELREQILKETPLKRQGTPQEVANMVCCLCSEEFSYMTGQTLVIDGGRYN